ncbi:MAG: CDP-glycerol glycerophosphotransferase family protein [Bacteroidales bacterium]|nr:CDP-glycerol glycerophosphotransferase family protein [Bacteroidales bacterium]
MKILLYTICYLIYPLSFLFYRKKNRYAFGSFRGSFNDNAKYLFIYASTHLPSNIEVAWISQNKETVSRVRACGLKAYSVFSIRGAVYALTSRYWFFNSYTSDIMYCLSGGAVCINLWHGVGLKRIEYNITSGTLAKRYNKTDLMDVYCHPESFRKPDFFVSSTPFQTTLFSTSFRIPKERCLEFGYARNEILTQPESERKLFIQKYESEDVPKLLEKIGQYDKTLIYMPTWRDSQRDIFIQGMDLERLNEALANNNQLLLLKPHSNVVINDRVRALSDIVLLDGKMDIYPILPYTNVLITDYSSVLYDYLLMPDKDVILYLYDYKEYVAERDFYYPYDENVVGRKVYSFDELLQLIASDNYKLSPTERQIIVDRFWGETVGYDSRVKLLDFVEDLKR